MPDGEYNDTHPLSLTTGSLGPDPNIFNYKNTMKAHDREKFKISMDEEINNLTTNDIYKLALRSNVPETYNILRVVWNHRRKTTPDGIVYKCR